MGRNGTIGLHRESSTGTFVRTVIDIELPTSSRHQFVIPVPMKRIGDQSDCVHLRLGHSDARGILTGVEFRLSGRVTRLDLVDNGLFGLIPSELGSLTKLESLDRVTVWGVAGYGSGGGVMLTPGGAPALESGLSMAMAAGGTRGELISGGSGGFGLAFKADALWVGTSVDGVDGPAGRLAATEAAVTRFRTGLEGSREFLLAGRVSLRPSAEVGLRHDGGDAETGAGMDVGGGLILSDSSTGLAVDVRVRMLLVHQAEGFEERGMAVSFSYDPTPSTPLGLHGAGGAVVGRSGGERSRCTVGPGNDGGDGGDGGWKLRCGQPPRHRNWLRAAGGEPLRGHPASGVCGLGVRAGLSDGLRPDAAGAREAELGAGRRRPAPGKPDAVRRG